MRQQALQRGSAGLYRPLAVTFELALVGAEQVVADLIERGGGGGGGGEASRGKAASRHRERGGAALPAAQAAQRHYAGSVSTHPYIVFKLKIRFVLYVLKHGEETVGDVGSDLGA